MMTASRTGEKAPEPLHPVRARRTALLAQLPTVLVLGLREQTSHVGLRSLIAAPLAGLVPQQACGPPPASLGPQLASIRLQSAVSLVVELIVLTGLYGLLAGVIRRRARRRSWRGRTSAGRT